MKLMKNKFIRIIILLGVILIILFGLTIFLNFYLSSMIEEKVSKKELLNHSTKSFIKINKEFDEKVDIISKIENKLNLLHSERNKLGVYKKSIDNKSHVDLYFFNNTPFYTIVQINNTTDFFLMTNFSFELRENGMSTSYTPNKVMSLKRKVITVDELSIDEKNLLQINTNSKLNIMKKDLSFTINSIDKIKKSNDSLNLKKNIEHYKEILNSENKKLNDYIKTFSPDVIINLLSISKMLLIGTIGFFIVLIMLIINQLINSYNKASIIESLVESTDKFNESKIEKQKELVIVVNEFYKNKNDNSKDIIIEAIKASK